MLNWPSFPELHYIRPGFPKAIFGFLRQLFLTGPSYHPTNSIKAQKVITTSTTIHLMAFYPFQDDLGEAVPEKHSLTHSLYLWLLYNIFN